MKILGYLGDFWKVALVSFVLCTIFVGNIFAEDNSDTTGLKYKYRLEEGLCDESYDPYEKLNRKFFVFNAVLDHFILRPIALGYKRCTNDYTKDRVGSFLSNLGKPITTTNYLIQGNLSEALKSLWQFLINTTFGIGGLFDVAQKAHLTTKTQGFSNTLAYYGVAPGPYVVLPFFGGMSLRDVPDIVTNNLLNPARYGTSNNFKLATTATKLVDDRMRILPFTDFVSKHSADPYLAIRSAIHQNREASMKYPASFVCPQQKISQ